MGGADIRDLYASPDEYPGRQESVRVARIFARAPRSGSAGGD
jgi:hypothetical protein